MRLKDWHGMRRSGYKGKAIAGLVLFIIGVVVAGTELVLIYTHTPL
jgi:hypothetical protein